MFWIQALVKSAIVVLGLMGFATVLLWVERKQSAMMQDRIGPNRANLRLFGRDIRLAGLVHSLADGIKLVWKEDWRPPRADAWLYGLAPIVAIAPPLCLYAVIPFGPTYYRGHAWELYSDAWAADPAAAVVPMQVAQLDVGVLFVLAVAGAGVIGAALAGWSSDNKFSLMGGLRAASQMVSYEVALGLSLVGAMMVYQTVRLEEMVAWQASHAWGIFVQPLAFVLFLTAAIAAAKRIPFDLPEGESEVVAGYFTEYAGLKFAMFASADLIETVTASGVIVTVFLGGWQFPFVQSTGFEFHHLGMDLSWHWAHAVVVAVGVVTFVLKVLGMVFLQLQIRWTLPRFRYDQIMRLGWRMLLPATLVNILATGMVILFVNGLAAPPAEAPAEGESAPQAQR